MSLASAVATVARSIRAEIANETRTLRLRGVMTSSPFWSPRTSYAPGEIRILLGLLSRWQL